jgi:hypothetical protein
MKLVSPQEPMHYVYPMKKILTHEDDSGEQKRYQCFVNEKGWTVGGFRWVRAQCCNIAQTAEEEKKAQSAQKMENGFHGFGFALVTLNINIKSKGKTR